MVFDPSLNPYVERLDEFKNIVLLDPLFKEGTTQKYRVLDLGCGNGHFLQEYKLKVRDIWPVGVERRYKRVFKTAQKLDRSHGLVVQENWVDFLDHSPPHFWDEVWLQFPDPWPKERHFKHRNVNASNLKRIHRVLKSSGTLNFRSDCHRYFIDLQNLNTQLKLFSSSIGGQGDLFQDHPETLFQKKFKEKRIPIYSLRLKK